MACITKLLLGYCVCKHETSLGYVYSAIMSDLQLCPWTLIFNFILKLSLIVAVIKGLCTNYLCLAWFTYGQSKCCAPRAVQWSFWKKVGLSSKKPSIHGWVCGIHKKKTLGMVHRPEIKSMYKGWRSIDRDRTESINNGEKEYCTKSGITG